MSETLKYKYWPNTDGNLGNKKVQIPDGVNTFWPEGDALIGNFVYKDNKLAGFVDTKALTVNDSKTTTFPYDYVNIQVDKSLEGVMTFNKGERTKYLTISYTTSGNSGSETFDFVIIDFNTTDAETINTVRTAKRVVDKTMYAEDGSVIGTWDTSKIEVGGIHDAVTWVMDGMFCNIDMMTYEERGLILTEFNSDLSSLRNGSTMFGMCIGLTSFSSDLSSLRNGSTMFASCSALTSFTSDLPSLTDGSGMFNSCNALTSFSSDLSSLTNGEGMFFETAFVSFSTDLSNLTYGHSMFNSCPALTSFDSNLSSLTDGEGMFYSCYELTTFSSDLSSLTYGATMFYNCDNLTSFNADLSSLTNGAGMFKNCKLDTASVQNIANTIKDVTSLTNGSSGTDEVYKKIDIGIGNSTPNDQEKSAFNTIASKGWTVYVNGSEYTPSSVSSIKTLDELGNEVETPIPYYAKPVPATEETASYVDANGNFFNIVGGQFIYGDDISTYGMFTCEEDAAANMRLTKIEKPSISKFALKR